MIRLLSLAALNLAAAPALAETATVTAEHQGFREYYCQTKGTLTNTGANPIREINGYFEIFENGENTGRSRGTSFLNVEPGASAEAVFEAPNVPCHTATAYEFVVSACMEGNSFLGLDECASRIEGTGMVISVRPR